jgi:hypothetical protein
MVLLAVGQDDLMQCSFGATRGDAMAEMNEVDTRKMLELLQAIADALQEIEKELIKIVGSGKYRDPTGPRWRRSSGIEPGETGPTGIHARDRRRERAQNRDGNASGTPHFAYRSRCVGQSRIRAAGYLASCTHVGQQSVLVSLVGVTLRREQLGRQFVRHRWFATRPTPSVAAADGSSPAARRLTRLRAEGKL